MTIGGTFYEEEAEGESVIRTAAPKKKSDPVVGTKDGAHYTRLSNEFLEWRKGFEGFWRATEDGYRRMEFEPKNSPREDLDQVYPGRIYRIVHMTEAAILSANVKFYLEGYSPSLGEEHAALLENLGNADWTTETAVMREMRVCARDASKYGFGVAMSSYECDYAEEAREDTRSKRRRARVEDPEREAIEQSLEAQVAARMSLGEEELRSPTYEMDARILREDISTRRISPWLFGVDQNASNLSDAQRVWRYTFAPVEAVRNYPYFKNAGRVEPVGLKDYQELLGRDRKRSPGDWARRQIDKVMICEMFERDAVSGKWRMVTFVPNQNIILRSVESPYWIGHPFRMLTWNQDGDCIFPQSDILPVYTEILAERLLLTKVLDGYARQQEDTYLYDTQAFKNPGEIYGPTHPAVGKWIGVDRDANQQVSAFVHQVPVSQKSGDVLNLLAALERSMMTSSGFSPNQFGQALKSGTTASEANNISAYSTAAQAHKLAGMEAFLSEVVRDRVGLACQFYDSERVARVLGPEAANKWARAAWTESDVQNFRICVKPGSTRPVNDDTRAQQLVSIIQLMTTNPIAATFINQMELWKRLFHSLGFQEGSSILQNVDPAQIEQLQMMMAQSAAMGGKGGSAPGAGGPPSGEAGAAQMRQG